MRELNDVPEKWRERRDKEKTRGDFLLNYGGVAVITVSNTGVYDVICEFVEDLERYTSQKTREHDSSQIVADIHRQAARLGNGLDPSVFAEMVCGILESNT